MIYQQPGKRPRAQKARFWIGAIFFVWATVAGVSHFLTEKGITLPFRTASIDAICPFGALETLYAYLSGGTLIGKIHPSNLVMGLGLTLATLVGGAFFCGWICPFGTLQEWSGKLGRRMLGRRYNHMIPQRVDRSLQYLRYVVALFFLAWTWAVSSLVFAQYDPWRAFLSLAGGEIAVGGIIALVVSLVGSLFVERFWCRYLCPMGAVTGLVGKISIFKPRRNATTCISCHACTNACPFHIDVEHVTRVTSAQCNRCLNCVDACPVKDTLTIGS